MHRSEDRGRLGRPGKGIDAPKARTRRERRLLHTEPETPPPTSPSEAEPTTPSETTVTAGAVFSLAGLFSPANKDLPDVQPNILAVCTGNICRSPLAETVLATRLAGLDISVHSAGTQALVGYGMPREALAIATRNGVPSRVAAAHRARLLSERLMRDADLVLTMAAEHSKFAVGLEPRRMHQTFTVREFARLAASLDNTTLRTIARDSGNARTRLGALVQSIADQRGVTPRADGDENVIDPYGQSFDVYEQSEADLLPALAQVERVIRVALA